MSATPRLITTRTPTVTVGRIYIYAGSNRSPIGSGLVSTSRQSRQHCAMAVYTHVYIAQWLGDNECQWTEVMRKAVSKPPARSCLVSSISIRHSSRGSMSSSKTTATQGGVHRKHSTTVNNIHNSTIYLHAITRLLAAASSSITTRTALMYFLNPDPQDIAQQPHHNSTHINDF